MFHISVDEYFYPQEKAKKSTIRRQIDVSLDELTDEELKIIQGTIDGIMKYKGREANRLLVFFFLLQIILPICFAGSRI